MSEQSSGFEGTQPVRVGVDLDKYIDQRIEAGFRARENVLWRGGYFGNGSWYPSAGEE